MKDLIITILIIIISIIKMIIFNAILILILPLNNVLTATNEITNIDCSYRDTDCTVDNKELYCKCTDKDSTEHGILSVHFANHACALKIVDSHYLPFIVVVNNYANGIRKMYTIDNINVAQLFVNSAIYISEGNVAMLNKDFKVSINCSNINVDIGLGIIDERTITCIDNKYKNLGYKQNITRYNLDAPVINNKAAVHGKGEYENNIFSFSGMMSGFMDVLHNREPTHLVGRAVKYVQFGIVTVVGILLTCIILYALFQLIMLLCTMKKCIRKRR